MTPEQMREEQARSAHRNPALSAPERRRPDHERIWLEPDITGSDERLWCQDDVWTADAAEWGGVLPTEYIRADLHAAAVEAARVEERERIAVLIETHDAVTITSRNGVTHFLKPATRLGTNTHHMTIAAAIRACTPPEPKP